MVSEVHLQEDIDDLGQYLSYGKAENKNRTEDRSERVAWESGRNVGGAESIGLAKRQMKWTAASSRVEKPVYQVIVSWQSGNEDEGVPPDDPSREEMEETADRVLEGLGLSEHQAWIVAHKDTETPHMHMMVNRVHPGENKAWSLMRDEKNIYNTLREIEKEKGWHRPAPLAIEEKWAQDREKSLQYWEEEHEKWDRERSVRLWAREEGVSDALQAAQSWEEATAAVEEQGARLEPRHRRGMVLKKGEKTAALSSIDPKISRPRLERRFGQSWEAYRGQAPSMAQGQDPRMPREEERPETGLYAEHSYNTSPRKRKAFVSPPDGGLSRRERTLRKRLPSALEEAEWAVAAAPETAPDGGQRPQEGKAHLLELHDRGPDSLSSEQVHLAMPESREPELPARKKKRLLKRIEALQHLEEAREKGDRSGGGSDQRHIEERYQEHEDLKRAVGKDLNRLSDEQLKTVGSHLDDRGQETARDASALARKELLENIEALRQIEETQDEGARPDGGPEQDRIEERYQDYNDLKRAVGREINQMSEERLRSVASHLDAQGQEIARRAGAFERNERLYEEAQAFYEETLEQTPDRDPQKQYVKERTHDAEEEGEIGIAPDEWGEFKKRAKGQGYTERELVEADLAKERRDDTRANLRQAINDWGRSFSTFEKNDKSVRREKREDFEAYVRGHGPDGNGNVRDRIAENEVLEALRPKVRSDTRKSELSQDALEEKKAALQKELRKAYRETESAQAEETLPKIEEERTATAIADLARQENAPDEIRKAASVLRRHVSEVEEARDADVIEAGIRENNDLLRAAGDYKLSRHALVERQQKESVPPRARREMERGREVFARENKKIQVQPVYREGEGDGITFSDEKGGHGEGTKYWKIEARGEQYLVPAASSLQQQAARQGAQGQSAPEQDRRFIETEFRSDGEVLKLDREGRGVTPLPLRNGDPSTAVQRWDRAGRKVPNGKGVFDTFKNEIVYASRDKNGRIRKLQGRWNEGTRDPDIPERNTQKPTLQNVEGHEPGEAVFGARYAQSQEGEEVFVTEGFSDALAARSAGRKAVALTGNNITEEEADLIAGLTGDEDPKVTIMLDGEDSGRVGSINVVEEMEKRGVPVDVVRPPEGRDVDEMTKARGEDALNKYIESNRVDGLTYAYEKAAVAEGLPTEEVGPKKAAERFDRALGIAASAPTARRREKNFGRLLEMKGDDQYRLIREAYEEKLREKGHAEPELDRYETQASITQSESRGPTRDVSGAENTEQDVGVPTDPDALKEQMYVGEEGQEAAIEPDLETEENEPKAASLQGDGPENDDLGVGDSEGTDPESTDPESTDPESTDPESTDPESPEPENPDPESPDPQGEEKGPEPVRFEAENGEVLVKEHADPGAKTIVQHAGDETKVEKPVHEEEVFAVTSTVSGSETEASPTETREEIAKELSAQFFGGELRPDDRKQVEPEDIPVALRGEEEPIRDLREQWVSVTERLRKDYSHDEAKRELIGDKRADLADLYVDHINDPQGQVASTERPVRPSHFDDNTEKGREKRDKVLTEGIEERLDEDEDLSGEIHRGRLERSEDGDLQVNRISKEMTSFGVGGPESGGAELPSIREQEVDVIVVEVREVGDSAYQTPSYYAVPGPNEGEIDLDEEAFDLERPDGLVEEHRDRDERRARNLQRIYMGKSDEPQKSNKETPDGVDTSDHLASVNPNHEPADGNTASEERHRFAAELNWDAVHNAEVTDGRYETRERMSGGRYETARAEVPIEYVFEDPEGYYEHDIDWSQTKVEQPGKFVDSNGEHSFPAERGHFYGKVFHTPEEAERHLKTEVRERLTKEKVQAYRDAVKSEVRKDLKESGVKKEIRSAVEDEVLEIDPDLRRELKEKTRQVRSELSDAPAETSAEAATAPQEVPGGTRAVEERLDEAGLRDELEEAREKIDEGPTEEQKAKIRRETDRRFEQKVQVETDARLSGLEGETIEAQVRRELREDGTESAVRAAVREDVLGIDESSRQKLEAKAENIRADLRQEGADATAQAAREEISRLAENGDLPEDLEKTWRAVAEAGSDERQKIDRRTEERLRERAAVRAKARQGKKVAEVKVREQVKSDRPEADREAIEEETERRIRKLGEASDVSVPSLETAEDRQGTVEPAPTQPTSGKATEPSDQSRSFTVTPEAESRNGRLKDLGLDANTPDQTDRLGERAGGVPEDEIRAEVEEKIEEKLDQPVLDPDGLYDGKAPDYFDPVVTREKRVADAKGKGVDPETGEKAQENPVLIEESWSPPAEEEHKLSRDNVGEIIPARLESVEGEEADFQVVQKGTVKRARDERETETVLSFGKHEGKTVREVVDEDREYAERIARDMDGRPDLQEAFREAVVEKERQSQGNDERFRSIGQAAMSFKESDRAEGKIRGLESRLKSTLTAERRTLEAKAKVKRDVKDDLRSVEEMEELVASQNKDAASEEVSEPSGTQERSGETTSSTREEAPDPLGKPPATEQTEWEDIEQSLRSREDLRQRDEDLGEINERLATQLSDKDTKVLINRHDDRAEELIQNRSEQQRLGAQQERIVSQVETINEEIRDGLDSGASSEKLDELYQRRLGLMRDQEEVREQENGLIEDEGRLEDITEGYRREIQRRGEMVPESSLNLAQVAARKDLERTEQALDVSRRTATAEEEAQTVIQEWKRQVEAGDLEATSTDLDAAIEEAETRKNRFEATAKVEEIDLDEKQRQVENLEEKTGKQVRGKESSSRSTRPPSEEASRETGSEEDLEAPSTPVDRPGPSDSDVEGDDLDVETYLRRRREAIEEDRVPGTEEVVENLDRQVSLQELKEHRDRLAKDLHETQQEALQHVGDYKEKNQTVKDLSQQVGDGEASEEILSELKSDIEARENLWGRLAENADDRLGLRSRLDAANRVIEERDGQLSKRALMVRMDLADERAHIGDKINWEMETQAEIDKQARRDVNTVLQGSTGSAQARRAASSIKRSLDESKEAAQTRAEEAELEQREGEERGMEIEKSEMPREEDLLGEFKTGEGAVRVQYSDYMDRRIVEQWSYEDLDDIQLDEEGLTSEIQEGPAVQSEEIHKNELLESAIIGDGDRPIKVNYDRAEKETAEQISEEIFDGEIVERTGRDRSQAPTTREGEGRRGGIPPERSTSKELDPNPSLEEVRKTLGGSESAEEPGTEEQYREGTSEPNPETLAPDQAEQRGWEETADSFDPDEVDQPAERLRTLSDREEELSQHFEEVQAERADDDDAALASVAADLARERGQVRAKQEALAEAHDLQQTTGSEPQNGGPEGPSEPETAPQPEASPQTGASTRPEPPADEEETQKQASDQVEKPNATPEGPSSSDGPTGSDRLPERQTDNEESKDDRPASTEKRDGPAEDSQQVDENLTIEQYLEERGEASEARREALDRQFSVEDLRTHRKGIREKLRDQQVATIETNRKIGYLNEDIKAAARQVERTAEAEEVGEVRSDLETLKTTINRREEAEDRLSTITASRRRLARQARWTDEVIRDRTGQADDYSIDAGRRHTRNREQLQKERSARYEKQAEVEKQAAAAFSALGNRIIGEEDVPSRVQLSGRLMKESSTRLKKAKDLESRAEEAESLSREASEQAQKFASAADERGMRTEGGEITKEDLEDQSGARELEGRRPPEEPAESRAEAEAGYDERPENTSSQGEEAVRDSEGASKAESPEKEPLERKPLERETPEREATKQSEPKQPEAEKSEPQQTDSSREESNSDQEGPQERTRQATSPSVSAEDLQRRQEILTGQAQRLSDAQKALAKRLEDEGISEEERSRTRQQVENLREDFKALQREVSQIKDQIDQALSQDGGAGETESEQETGPAGRKRRTDQTEEATPPLSEEEIRRTKGAGKASGDSEEPAASPNRKSAREESQAESGVERLRKEKDLVQRRQRAYIDDNQDRIKYLSDRNNELQEQARTLNELVKSRAPTEEIEAVQQEIAEKRAARATVEKEITEDRTEVQKRETKLAKIEKDLSKQGHLTTGDLEARQDRLRAQGKTDRLLEKVEGQRETFAHLQADTMRRLERQVEEEERYAPQSFDPAARAQDYRALATRAQDAQDDFQKQHRETMRRARLAGEKSPKRAESTATRGKSQVEGESVAEAQLKQDLEAVIEAEREARAAFDRSYEDGEQVRSRLEEKAFKEGVDERTRSFKRALDQVERAPDDLGVLAPDRSGETVGEELAQKEQTAAAKRRKFRQKYGGRRAGELAQFADQEDRSVLQALQEPEVRDPATRQAAARSLREQAEARRKRLQEEFLEVGTKSFESPTRAQKAYQENRARHGEETARRALKNPAAFVGEDLSFESPGPYNDPTASETLQDLDSRLRQAGQEAEAYRQIEEMARLQANERSARKGLKSLADTPSSEEEQTTWDRLQSPESVERSSAPREEQNTKTAHKKLKQSYERQKTQESVGEVVQLVKEADQKETAARTLSEAREASRPTRNGGSTVADEKAKLTSALETAFEEQRTSKQNAEGTGSPTTAHEKAQQAADIIATQRGGQGVEEVAREDNAPRDVQEAANILQTIKNAKDREVNPASMLKEGIQRDNDVLRLAGRTRIKKDVEIYGQKHEVVSDGSPDIESVRESVASFQKMYDQTLEEWKNLPRTSGIEKEVYERVDRLDPSEKEHLRREAARNEQANRALNIAEGDDPGTERQVQTGSREKTRGRRPSNENRKSEGRTQTQSRGGQSL